MRTLVITVGTPASGKSTWIASQGLESYTLSPDIIRLQYQAPETQIDGSKGISQKNDGAVWDHLFTLLEHRMQNGDFTIIDATHTRSKLINRYRTLAKQYRYRIIAVDFRDVSLEELHRRNDLRGVKRVPADVIDNMYARIQYNIIPSWIKVVKPDEFTIDEALFDYTDKYNSIRFIGDVHSSFKQLKQILSDTEQDKQLTVFIGDLFDRGEDAAGVFKLIQDSPDYVLLEGNHDSHLIHYKEWLAARTSGDHKYAEFKRTVKLSPATRRTFYQFMQAGITVKDVTRLRTRYWQMFHAKFGDRIIFANHAGYPTIPSLLTSTKEFIKGVGSYSDITKIQEHWLNAMPTRALQIHGHRNIKQQKPEVVKNRMYNITGNVEYGGELVAVIVPVDGDCTVHTVKNTDYTFTTNPSLYEPSTTCVCANDKPLFELMQEHTMVNVRELDYDVFACNFTTKAFKTGTYDDISTKARGLFIRSDSSIIARGYEKFFNYKENPQTDFDAITNQITFPTVKVEKPNGYLGLLSYDTIKDAWFIASKSSITSSHSIWFREQLKPYLTDELRDFLVDNNVTLTFEVIEPIKDPHIVKYTKPEIILLDAIKNQIKFEVLSEVEMINVQVLFEGVHRVSVVKVISTIEELRADIEEMEQDTNADRQNFVEGYVYVGANGYRFKYKTRWYRFWKHMRAVATRVYKVKDDRSKLQQIRENMYRAIEYHVIELATKYPYTDAVKLRDDYFKLIKGERWND